MMHLICSFIFYLNKKISRSSPADCDRVQCLGSPSLAPTYTRLDRLSLSSNSYFPYYLLFHPNYFCDAFTSFTL